MLLNFFMRTNIIVKSLQEKDAYIVTLDMTDYLLRSTTINNIQV
jgi:hypothetical protein